MKIRYLLWYGEQEEINKCEHDKIKILKLISKRAKVIHWNARQAQFSPRGRRFEVHSKIIYFFFFCLSIFYLYHFIHHRLQKKHLKVSSCLEIAESRGKNFKHDFSVSLDSDTRHNIKTEG